MKLISAYVLYNAFSNSWVDDGSLVTINCQQLQAFTPRRVWIQRTLPAGDGTDIIYMPTFSINSTDITQYGNNLVQGLYIEQDGKGIIVDVADINTLITACNQCCDDGPAVTLTRYYTGGVPLFSQPTDQSYCITRLDDGSPYAHNQASLAYVGQYHGSLRLVSNISGVSRYQAISFTGWPPTPRGTDTIIPGTCS